jgi:hypothetical protein
MVIDDGDVNVLDSDCTYHDLSALPRNLSHSIMHLNVRSILHKTAELEGLLSILEFPMAVLVTETWLEQNNNVANITNYSFISSPRVNGRGGGAGIFVASSVKYSVKAKSSDGMFLDTNIDFVFIELLDLNINLCCMYCPPHTKLDDIFLIIEHLKSNNSKQHFIIGGDLMLICLMMPLNLLLIS